MTDWQKQRGERNARLEAGSRFAAQSAKARSRGRWGTVGAAGSLFGPILPIDLGHRVAQGFVGESHEAAVGLAQLKDKENRACDRERQRPL